MDQFSLFKRQCCHWSLYALCMLMVSATFVGCGDDPEPGSGNTFNDTINNDSNDNDTTNYDSNDNDSTNHDSNDNDNNTTNSGTVNDQTDYDLSDRFGGATLADQEDAEEWSSTSPPNIYFMSIFSPVLTMAGDEMDEDEIECPNFEEVGGGTTEVTGGCTDEDGNEWSGSGSITDSHDRAVAFPGQGFSADISISEMVLDDLTQIGPESCESDPSIEHETEMVYNGTITVDEVSTDHFVFDVDLEMSGVEMDHDTCEVGDFELVIDYKGEFELHDFDADGEAIVHDWSGQGALGGSGDGAEQSGWANIETPDQAFDLDACEHKPMAGSTIVTSQGTELEIEYDGADNCDEDATATWYLDGDEQGELTGIHCSTTKGATGLAGILLMLVALMVVRRQSRRVVRA